MARKNFKLYGPFYGWGSTASRLEPLRERKFSIPKKLYITTDSKKNPTSYKINFSSNFSS